MPATQASQCQTGRKLGNRAHAWSRGSHRKLEHAPLNCSGHWCAEAAVRANTQANHASQHGHDRIAEGWGTHRWDAVFPNAVRSGGRSEHCSGSPLVTLGGTGRCSVSDDAGDGSYSYTCAMKLWPPICTPEANAWRP